MPSATTKTAKDDFVSGIEAFNRIQGASVGSYQADAYVASVADACKTLQDDINQFEGYDTGVGQLKGDIAEIWHADTFNINSALKQSSFKAVVDRSHDYASVDVRTKQGDNVIENFGLKYLRDAQSSAKAQAISHFQRFCEYKAMSGRPELTFDSFLEERGLSPEEVLQSDPIYTGQTRIIPSDQLKEAIAYLKFKIAKEQLIRPEQVKRYQDTLEHLQSRLKAPDGTESNDLSTAQAIEKAAEAKEGDYNAAEDGFTTADLIQFEHIVKQGLKAGTTAAVITLVLKMAPKFYRLLNELIINGFIDKEDLREFGLSTLSESGTSFIRGFVAASITAACKSGVLSESLKTVSPGVIAAATVIVMGTISDAIKLRNGKITQGEFTYNLSRTVFVTSCAVGLGSLTQVLLPIPFSYLLGSLVGSVLASFVFTPLDNLVMSFCIYSGFTMFGIVEQNYVLPEEVIKEIGVDVFDYENDFPQELATDDYSPDYIQLDEAKPEMIHIMRRGVISVHRVGYQYI